MNVHTTILTGTGVLVVVGLGVAWHHAGLVREAEAELAKLAGRRATASAEMQRLETRVAAVDGERVELRQTLATLQAAPLAAAKPATASTSAPPRLPSIAERLQREPETQILWIAYQRSRATQRYGALLRALALAPFQVERFHVILSRRDEQNMDLNAVMSEQGLSARDPALVKTRQKTEAEYQTAQREFLGDEGYRQLLDFERTAPIREMVNGWAGGAVAITRAPFTAEQGEQLIQILANASESYRRGHVTNTFDIDWDTADAKAREILSDAQFTLFKTMEPPLPVGGRFQSQLYRCGGQAQRADTSARPEPAAKPPGG